MKVLETIAKLKDAGLDEKSAAKWERSRRRGRGFFVLVYGVVAWGVPTGVLFSLLMWWLTSAAMSRISPDFEVGHLWLLALSVPAFAVGGYFWGAEMCKTMESKYLEYMRESGRADGLRRPE